jgi:hypothetical protein
VNIAAVHMTELFIMLWQIAWASNDFVCNPGCRVRELAKIAHLERCLECFRMGCVDQENHLRGLVDSNRILEEQVTSHPVRKFTHVCMHV